MTTWKKPQSSIHENSMNSKSRAAQRAEMKIFPLNITKRSGFMILSLTFIYTMTAKNVTFKSPNVCMLYYITIFNCILYNFFHLHVKHTYLWLSGRTRTCFLLWTAGICCWTKWGGRVRTTPHSATFTSTTSSHASRMSARTTCVCSRRWGQTQVVPVSTIMWWDARLIPPKIKLEKICIH